MAIENLSPATLGAHHSAACRAQEAALETDRDDLYEAACELAKLYRVEIQRRTFAAQGDQGALDELNAGLRGLSVAQIQAERGLFE